MPLDIDKVRSASLADFCALALCEFSRLVDAIERIAPAEDVPPTAPDVEAKCPCPPELRVKRSGVMGEAVVFECGLCHEPVQQPVEA
jgi:hypothetical protein